MAKIKPVQIFVNGGYLYVIDEKGVIWSKHVPSGAWTTIGELPEQRERPEL